MLELYDNIRNLRKQRQWTQEELAAKMGYTDRSMIAKIESGKVDLAQSKIIEFAKVFGVEAGDLMGPVDVTSDELQKLNRYKELIDCFERAPHNIQDSVMDILKSVQPKS